MKVKQELTHTDALPVIEKNDDNVIMKSIENLFDVPLCDRDIWDLTSPELICLAATDPTAVIRHIQDIGKELDLRITGTPRPGWSNRGYTALISELMRS